MPNFLKIALIASFAAGPVLAKDRVDDLVSRWDLDTDSRITLGEVQERVEQIFRMFDKDGDGALDTAEYDEFDAFREKEAEELGTGDAIRAVTGLSRGFTDINFDGRVTREEMMETAGKWFLSMDRNRDGQVDARDFTPGE